MTRSRVVKIVASVSLLVALTVGLFLVAGEDASRDERTSSAAADWLGKSPSDREVTVALIAEPAAGRATQVTVMQRIGDGAGCRTRSVIVKGPAEQLLGQDAEQVVGGSGCVGAVRYARFRGEIEMVTIGSGSKARDTVIAVPRRATTGVWWTAGGAPVFAGPQAGPAPVVERGLLPDFSGPVQTGWLSPAATSNRDLLFDCAVGYAPACVTDQIAAEAHDDLSK